MNTKKELIKAKKFAQELHNKDFRISGESYFDHIERVVEILKSHGIEDYDTLIATYLHHCLYNNEKNLSYIEDEFGLDVANLVKNYRLISSSKISDVSPKDINEKFIIQAYLNLSKDPRTLLIRLADKVDNIQTAHLLPKERAEKVAERALYIYSPISRLIGLYSFTKTLEENALKILSPGDYYRIENYLETNKTQIKDTLDEIQNFLIDIISEKINNPKVYYRIKNIYSILKKQRSYIEKHKNINQIYDIAAMRIIVNTVEECYMVEDILESLWESIEGERDDYISKPKPNGYQSLQNAFKINRNLNLEVQIRTWDMHDTNEYGVASHAFYKLGENIKKSISKDSRQDTFLKDLSYALNKEHIKIDHFNKNIYVFTPKGDIKELPRGSNVVDFAYSIHKDIGNKCIGANVNGEFKGVEHLLEDGDRIEVVTSGSKTYPSSKWIDIVKTKRAREQIRKSLRENT